MKNAAYAAPNLFPECAPPPRPRFWVAVASADHVRIGRARGFMQVCHGKRGPLARVMPGDGVVYYSPTRVMGVADRLQSLTAIGTVRSGEPYQVETAPGFRPFRREVEWREAQETPIAPLLPRLEFSADRRNWGYQLRFGLFEITRGDFDLIAVAMGASAQLALTRNA